MKKVSIVLAALFLASILTACNQDNENNDDANNTEEPTPVETAEVTKGDLVADRGVFGRTVPSKTSPVMLQQPGEVDSLEVENGDTVEEDDTLVTVTSRAGEETITAPDDGTVINLDAKEGAMVSAEDPFAVIADLDVLTLQMDVTASVQGLFEKGETYSVKAEGETYDADVSSIGLMPNDNGLYTVEADLDNEDNALLPGMVAELSIPQMRAEDTVIVPTAAVEEDSEGTYVFVVNDDTVSRTEIETTDVQSDETAVKSGLKKGDVVVTSGQLSLQDNSEVNIVEEGE